MKRPQAFLSPLLTAFLICSLALPPQSAWALRGQPLEESAGLEEFKEALRVISRSLGLPSNAPVVAPAAGLEQGVYSQSERKAQVADSLRGIPAPGQVSFSYEGTARGNDLAFRIAAAMDPGKSHSQIPLVMGSYERGHFKHALMPLIPPLAGVSGVAAKEFSFGELHAAVNKKISPMGSLIQSFNPESLPFEDDSAAVLAWQKRVLARMRAVLDVKGSRKEEIAQALETLKQQHTDAAPDLNQAVAVVEEVIQAEMQAAERVSQAWHALEQAARARGQDEKKTVTFQEYKEATLALQEVLSFWPRVFDTLKIWFEGVDDWSGLIPLQEASDDLGSIQEGMLQERRLALSLRAKPEAVTVVYYRALGLALHGLLEQFERRVESEPDTISPEALRFLYLQIYYLAIEQTITLFWLTREPALPAEHTAPIFADRFFVLEPAAGASPWRVRREVHGEGMITGTSVRSAFFSPLAIRSSLRVGEAVALGFLTYTGAPDVEQVERFFEEWARLQKILPTGTAVGMALVDPNGGVRVYFPKFQPGDEKGWALAYGNRQPLIATVRASLAPINETLIADFERGIAGLEIDPDEVLSFDEQRAQAADRHEAVKRLKNILKEYGERLGHPLGLFARVSAPVVQNLGVELRSIHWTSAREFSFLVDSILLRISKILAEQSAADNEVLTQDFDPVAVEGLPPGRIPFFSAVSRFGSSTGKSAAGIGAPTAAPAAEIRFQIPALDGIEPETWSQRQTELDRKMGFLVSKAVSEMQKEPSLQGLAVDRLVEGFAKGWVVHGTFLKQSGGQQKPFSVLEQLQKGTWSPLDPKRFVAAFQVWVDQQRTDTVLGPVQRAAQENSPSPQLILEALESSEKGRLQYGVSDLLTYRTAGQELLTKTTGAALTQVGQDLERAVDSFYEGDIPPAERLEQIEQAFGNWTDLLARIPAVFQEGLGLSAQGDVLRERVGFYREVVDFVADSQQFESEDQSDLLKIGLSRYVRLLSGASDLRARLSPESAWHEPLLQRAVGARSHFHGQVAEHLLIPLQEMDPAQLPEALKQAEKFFSVMLDAERKSAVLFVNDPGEEDFGEILDGLRNRLKAFETMKRSDLFKQGMVLEPGDQIFLKQFDGEGREISSLGIAIRYQRFESNGARPSARLEVKYPSTFGVISGSETVPAFSDASQRVELAPFLRALEAQSKNGETRLQKEIILAGPASLSGVPGIYKAQVAIVPLRGFLDRTLLERPVARWLDFTHTRGRLDNQIGRDAVRTVFETAWLRLIAAELNPKTGFLTLRVEGNPSLNEFLPEVAVANVLSLENKASRSEEPAMAVPPAVPAPTAGLEEPRLYRIDPDRTAAVVVQALAGRAEPIGTRLEENGLLTLNYSQVSLLAGGRPTPQALSKSANESAADTWLGRFNRALERMFDSPSLDSAVSTLRERGIRRVQVPLNPRPDSGEWPLARVKKAIRTAARRGLSLNPGAIRSEKALVPFKRSRVPQMETPAGQELAWAYGAVTRGEVPELKGEKEKDWRVALRAAGQNPEEIYRVQRAAARPTLNGEKRVYLDPVFDPQTGSVVSGTFLQKKTQLDYESIWNDPRVSSARWVVFTGRFLRSYPAPDRPYPTIFQFNAEKFTTSLPALDLSDRSPLIAVYVDPRDPYKRPQKAFLLPSQEQIYPFPKQIPVYLDPAYLYRALIKMPTSVFWKETSVRQAKEVVFENVPTFRDGSQHLASFALGKHFHTIHPFDPENRPALRVTAQPIPGKRRPKVTGAYSMETHTRVYPVDGGVTSYAYTKKGRLQPIFHQSLDPVLLARLTGRLLKAGTPFSSGEIVNILSRYHNVAMSDWHLLLFDRVLEQARWAYSDDAPGLWNAVYPVLEETRSVHDQESLGLGFRRQRVEQLLADLRDALPQPPAPDPYTAGLEEVADLIHQFETGKLLEDRRTAARQLAAMGDKAAAAVPALRAALTLGASNPSAVVRGAAATALGKLALFDKQTVRVLFKTSVLDESIPVRVSARAALMHVGAKDPDRAVTIGRILVEESGRDEDFNFRQRDLEGEMERHLRGQQRKQPPVESAESEESEAPVVTPSAPAAAPPTAAVSTPIAPVKVVLPAGSLSLVPAPQAVPPSTVAVVQPPAPALATKSARQLREEQQELEAANESKLMTSKSAQEVAGILLSDRRFQPFLEKDEQHQAGPFLESVQKDPPKLELAQGLLSRLQSMDRAHEGNHQKLFFDGLTRLIDLVFEQEGRRQRSAAKQQVVVRDQPSADSAGLEEKPSDENYREGSGRVRAEMERLGVKTALTPGEVWMLGRLADPDGYLVLGALDQKLDQWTMPIGLDLSDAGSLDVRVRMAIAARLRRELISHQEEAPWRQGQEGYTGDIGFLFGRNVIAHPEFSELRNGDVSFLAQGDNPKIQRWKPAQVEMTVGEAIAAGAVGYKTSVMLPTLLKNSSYSPYWPRLRDQNLAWVRERAGEARAAGEGNGFGYVAGAILWPAPPADFSPPQEALDRVGQTADALRQEMEKDEPAEWALQVVTESWLESNRKQEEEKSKEFAAAHAELTRQVVEEWSRTPGVTLLQLAGPYFVSRPEELTERSGPAQEAIRELAAIPGVKGKIIPATRNRPMLVYQQESTWMAEAGVSGGVTVGRSLFPALISSRTGKFHPMNSPLFSQGIVFTAARLLGGIDTLREKKSPGVWSAYGIPGDQAQKLIAAARSTAAGLEEVEKMSLAKFQERYRSILDVQPAVREQLIHFTEQGAETVRVIQLNRPITVHVQGKTLLTEVGRQRWSQKLLQSVLWTLRGVETERWGFILQNKDMSGELLLNPEGLFVKPVSPGYLPSAKQLVAEFYWNRLGIAAPELLLGQMIYSDGQAAYLVLFSA